MDNSLNSPEAEKSEKKLENPQQFPAVSLLSLHLFQVLHSWKHTALAVSVGCALVYLFPNACRPRPEQRSSGHSAACSPSPCQRWDQFLLETRTENKQGMSGEAEPRGRRMNGQQVHQETRQGMRTGSAHTPKTENQKCGH